MMLVVDNDKHQSVATPIGCPSCIEWKDAWQKCYQAGFNLGEINERLERELTEWKSYGNKLKNALMETHEALEAERALKRVVKAKRRFRWWR